VDSYQFYKSLYDRELGRRTDLNSAISLPITILTILVTANLYLFERFNATTHQVLVNISYIIFILSLLSFLISLFYLVCSYNNLFKGFGYRNIAHTMKIRKFEVDVTEYNEKLADPKQRIDFEKTVIDKLTELTDSHIIFNDRRGKYLHIARIFIIATLILTGLRCLLLFF
jgi:hypothetical protein